jgi:GntR family transcriptional regulator
VRQAFAQLEADGLVVRKRGKGSYVSRPKIIRSLHNLFSFSDEIASMGLVPSSKVLAYEVITPGEEIMSRLSLFDPAEKVYSITRVRYAGEEPLALEMAFIPERMCPFLTQEMVERGSLYSSLVKEAGVKISHARETYETLLLGESEAGILGVPKDTGAFFVQRTSYTKTNEIFEYTVMIVRSDRCRYEVELTSDEVQMRRKVD